MFPNYDLADGPAPPPGGAGEQAGQTTLGGSSAGMLSSGGVGASAAGVSGSSSGGGVGGTPEAGTAATLAGSATALGGAGGEAGETHGEGGTPPVVEPRELAQGRPALASSVQSGNEVAKGNDGATNTRWCVSGAGFPHWWRVDLGNPHLLSSFSVRWEHDDHEYVYLIETSNDDKLYTTRVSNSATGGLQSADFPADIQARYVRITVTNINPAAWVTFYELSVLGF